MFLYKYELNIENTSYKPHVFESSEEIRVGDFFDLGRIKYKIIRTNYGNPVKLTATYMYRLPKEIEIPIK